MSNIKQTILHKINKYLKFNYNDDLGNKSLLKEIIYYNL